MARSFEISVSPWPQQRPQQVTRIVADWRGQQKMGYTAKLLIFMGREE
jgi:hypothetical protein